ncbi:MAG TPA: efflux RND transporter permease subunit [Gemmataceae bacterium]|jgi:multidrug efflux pump
MIARFFIDRPIFAAVLSIVITLTGAIALRALPIAQYPRITPPGVQVSIRYPGANAQVVADTVAAPIEQQVNGVPGTLYMSSQCGNDGSYTLTVTFDLDVDLNTALVMVQNRVTLAMPQLPDAVQNQGITIKKKTPDILLVVNFYSEDGRYDDLYLSNFAYINVRDQLFRVEGVSDINIFGERDYSIRAWLDPQKLASRNMTALDVAAAIRSQNVEAAAGQLGQSPTLPGQPFQLPLDALGRLSDPEQFGNIIIRVGSGAPIGSVAPPPVVLSRPPKGSNSSNSSNSTGGMTGNLVGAGMSGGGNVIGMLPGVGVTGLGFTGGNTTGGSTSPSGTTGSNPNASQPSVSTATTSDVMSSAIGAATVQTSTTNSSTSGSTTDAGTPSGSLFTGAGSSTRPQPTDSSIVRLRDVARVEMGAQNYNQASTFDGMPTVGLAVYQLPGTNALDVADAVKAKMKELEKRFPDGVNYKIAYDTTPFIRESVSDVVRTLLEAVVLVAIVVLLFLQNWRAALIPLLAVPVAIVGTFAVMAAFGFSLNNISLFGLVLAIGIVVDDAIVVVENVERWLEHGLPPREAARRAMDEVTGPVIAVALVLGAVFLPCAFISGITGQFFRQFAVTIAVSTAFSAFNSLTLSPALAAILLKPRGGQRDPLTWLIDVSLGWLFWLFNAGFRAGTSAYAWSVGRLLRVSILVLVVYAGLLVLTYGIFRKAPTGFIPQQDQGRLIVNVELPDSASLQRTMEVVAQVEQITRDDPGVAHTVSVSGMSFLLSANSSNFGSLFVILKPFDEREEPHLSDTAIMTRLRREWDKRVKDARVSVFGAPPIPGLSVAGGFKLMVEDRGSLGLPNLQKQTDKLSAQLKTMYEDEDGRLKTRPVETDETEPPGRKDKPVLLGLTTQFRADTPQLYMDIDRTKVESLGVTLFDLNQTLQMYLGSLYVNSFNIFGRYWQVTIQADGDYRARVESLNLLSVRNKWGDAVPLSTLVHVRPVNGPVMVQRYNLYTAAPVIGMIRPDISSGPVISSIDATAQQILPRSMKAEWTELMFMQIRAGNTAMYVFALSVLIVFLALAALYESWALPLAVILVVPLCLLCSVVGVLLTHKAVDIFVQIGFIVLVGLACKNSILIVEFAQQQHREGQPRYEATVEACRLRLRPILMTSFAFILGVVPLVIATGAGAEMRRSLGTAVFAGMLGVTLFGIFLTPVFFYVIAGLGETRLLSAASTRWVGSALVGGLLGALVGYLLTKLGVGKLPTTAIAGAGVGIVAGLLVPAIGRRVRPRPVAPPKE